MNVERDYEELLRLLNENKVQYCVVGAFSVAFYSRPRFSKDIDLLVKPTLENGKKIINALKEFGFGSLKLSAEDFIRKDAIIQLGYEPVRIDLMTSIEGCTFKEVWKTKKRGVYGRQKVFFIGLKELIKNKRVSARLQDKADLKLLLSSGKSKKK